MTIRCNKQKVWVPFVAIEWQGAPSIWKAKAKQWQSRGQAKAKQRQSEAKRRQSEGKARERPRRPMMKAQDSPRQTSWTILGHVGAILRPSWDILEPSRANFGLCNFGAVLAYLGPTCLILGLGVFLGPLCASLGPSWAILSHLMCILKPRVFRNPQAQAQACRDPGLGSSLLVYFLD
jgi:hypothetical protein